MSIKADSKKIPSLAKELSSTLVDWKLNPNKTTIIGHSLGSILAAKLSNQIYQNTGKQVQELIALDPASVMNYGLKSFQESNAKTSRCFVGENSELGDEGLASSCDRSYIMQFKPKLSATKEHSSVIDAYKRISLYLPFSSRNYLKLHNTNDVFPKNIKRFLADYFNGIIKVSTENNNLKPEFLKTKANNKIFNLYGTKLSDKIYCEEDSMTCIIESGNGVDKIFINDGKYERVPHSSNIIFLDFNKQSLYGDKLIIGKPDRLKILQTGNDNYLSVVKYIRAGQYMFSVERSVYLNGISGDELKEWVEVAKGNLPNSLRKKGKTIMDLPKLMADNPIIIIK